MACEEAQEGDKLYIFLRFQLLEYPAIRVPIPG